MENTFAIKVWNYFLYNHPYYEDVIKGAFKDDEWLARHISDKFVGYAHIYNDTAKAWTELYINLDSECQEKLAKWVLDNYKGVETQPMTVYRVSLRYSHPCDSDFESEDFYFNKIEDALQKFTELRDHWAEQWQGSLDRGMAWCIANTTHSYEVAEEDEHLSIELDPIIIK